MKSVSPIPSPAAHPNASASGLAGAVTILVLYVLEQFSIDVPTGVQLAAVTVASYAVLLLAGRTSK